MKRKSFKDILSTVEAEVKEGSLVSVDERQIAEMALGRRLEWVEVPDTRVTAGNYFQCLYEVKLPNHEARIARFAVEMARNIEP